MHERIFADPLNDEITLSSFAEDRKALIDKVESFRKHPIRQRLLYVFSVLAPFFYIFYIFLSAGIRLFFAFIAVFAVLGVVILYYYMQSIQHEIIMLLLCEKNKWVFSLAKDHERALKMARLFPDAFDRGDVPYNRFLDQIWGTLDRDDAVSFWSGKFEYEISDHNYPNGFHGPEFPHTKRTGQTLPMHEVLLPRFHMGSDAGDAERGEVRVYSRTAFILELGAVIPYSFSLFRKGIKRDLETESIEFNKKFNVIIHENGKQARLKIVNALSPSLQVRLVDFANKYALDCIVFQHNCMVVLFKENVWKARHTNFFKNVTIDERDVQLYNDLLEEMVSLPLEMRKYLD